MYSCTPRKTRGRQSIKLTFYLVLNFCEFGFAVWFWANGLVIDRIRSPGTVWPRWFPVATPGDFVWCIVCPSGIVNRVVKTKKKKFTYKISRDAINIQITYTTGRCVSLLCYSFVRRTILWTDNARNVLDSERRNAFFFFVYLPFFADKYFCFRGSG